MTLPASNRHIGHVGINRKANSRSRARRILDTAIRPLFENLENRTLLSAGLLDTTLNGSGYNVTAFGTGSSGSGTNRAQAIVLDSAGYLLAGSSSTGSVELAQFSSNGSLLWSTKTSLSSQAVTTTVNAVTIDSSNRIVIAGQLQLSGQDQDFLVARFLVSGGSAVADTSFGTGDPNVSGTANQGWTTTDFGDTSTASGVAIDGSGSIYLGGTATIGGVHDFAVAKYDTTGALITSQTQAEGSSDAYGTALAIDGSNLVLVGNASNASPDIAVQLFGTSSLTVGNSQLTDINSGSNDTAGAVAIDPSGNIVVAGDSNSKIAVVEYSSSATAIGNPSTTTTAATATGVAIQPNGAIDVSATGSSGANRTVVLARFVPSTGSTPVALDPGFGNSGIATPSFTNASNAANAIVLDGSKLVTAGYTVSGTNTQFLLARFQGNNAPTITPGATVNLTSTTELSTSNNQPVANGGDLVSSLLSQSSLHYVDADYNAPQGMAITAADNSNGQWYYSANGTTWTPVSSASSVTSALLLSPSYRVQFVANQYFNTDSTSVTSGPNPTLTFKAWDQTTGTAGQTADTTVVTDGNNAFSTSSATASISIASVNQPPVLTLAATPYSTLENQNVALGGISVSDVDAGANPIVMTLTVTRGTLSVNSSVTNGLPPSGIAYSNGNRTVTLTGSQSAIDTTLSYTTGLTYIPDTNYNSNDGADSLAVTVNDQGYTGTGGAQSASGSVSVNVAYVNQQPVRTDSSDALNPVTSVVGETVSLDLSGLTYAPGPASAVDEASQTLSVTFTALPSASLGKIELSDGTPVNTTASYTVAQLQGLQFATSSSAASPSSSSISFNVIDSGGTANGGINTLGQSMTLNVVAQASETWVAPASTWTITNNVTGSSALSQGDTVSDGTVTNKIFGITAFSGIQTAINNTAANGIVHILAGSYTELVTVSKSLTLDGIGSPTLTSPAVVSQSAVVSIDASNVIVQNLNILVNQPYVGAGIAPVSNGSSVFHNFDGLQVLNNTITSMGTGTGSGSTRTGLANPFGNPYTVGIAAICDGSGTAPNVTIQGNQILAGTGGPYPGGVSIFNRGIWLNEVQGTVGGSTPAEGNQATGTYQDMLVAFARGATTIENNTSSGAGINITEPNAIAPINILNNTFNPQLGGVDDASLFINHNYNSTSPVTIQGNTFTLISNAIGVLSGASTNVAVSGNIFNAASTVTGAAAIDVDTFHPASSQLAPFVSNSISITGNSFNAVSGSSVTAIQFANHKSGAATPDFGTITVGGSGALANAFSVNLANFITLATPTSTVSFSGDSYGSGQGVTSGNVTFTGGILDATGNTFAVSTGHTGSSLTLADYYEIENKITDGLDSSGPSMVRINAGNVYVSQLSETTNAGAVQRGVNAASSGDVVNVQAGDYVASSGFVDSNAGVVDDLYIAKPLTLAGANVGVDPNTGSRGAETIIQPANSDPNPFDPTAVNVVGISSSHVTIDGITVDGSNNTTVGFVHAAGAPVLSGRTIDASEGISSYVDVGSVTVQNNIIENTAYTGVDFQNGPLGSGAATSGNYITHNSISNLSEAYGYGVGVILYGNFYADVSVNVMQNVHGGVQTGNFSNANPGSTGSITNNTISASSFGIFFNLMYGSATGFSSISGNIISAINDSARASWEGILLGSLQSSFSQSIGSNSIDASAANASTLTTGYEIWNTPTAGAVTFTGGTISGVDYGVWVNTYEGYGSPGDATHATISGVNITASQVGVYVEDSALNTSHPAVSATIQNSTIEVSGATAILVSGGNASATVTGDTLTGNTTVIDDEGGSLTIGAGDSITGGTTGLLINGSTSAVVGNTLNNLTFSGQSGNYITLSSTALGGAVSPTAFNGTPLNASGVTFDGTAASSLSTTSTPTAYAVENKIADYLDDATLGYVSLQPTQVYVSQASETPNAGAIQRGVNVAPTAVTGTVNVQGGTFLGSITVDRSVKLLGAQAGTSANDSMRTGLESTLLPSAVGDSIIEVDASDVTIDGFTLDGHNAALNGDSGIAHINGVTAAAGYGISNNADGVGNITVQNNIIRNIIAYGILLDSRVTNPDASSTGNAIADNLIDNVAANDQYPSATGMLLADNFYGTVSDNVLTRTFDGIIVNHYGDYGPTGATLSVSGNQVESSDSGIYLSDAYAGPGQVSISNNTVTTASGASGTNRGLVFEGVSASAQLSVSGNSASGGYAGVFLWGNDGSSASTVTISGGTLSNNAYGVVASNYDDRIASTALAASQATLDGVTIQGSSTGGVLVQDYSGLGPAVGLTITADTQITGSPTGILVSGRNASANITGNLGSIDGNNIGIDVNGGTATITGNHIYDNTTGISLENGGSATVTGNDFTGTTANGTDLLINSTAAANPIIGGVLTGDNFGGSSFFIKVGTAQNLDATAATFNGLSAGASTLAQDYGYEDEIVDYLDNPVLGYVSLNATNVYVAASSETATAGAIQRGVNVAPNSGGTVNVQAGAFAGPVTVSTPLTVLGAGSATSGTVVSVSSGNGLTIQSDGVTAQGLRIAGNGSTNGIYFNSGVNHTSLTDIVSTGHAYALEVHNSADVQNLSMNQVSLINSSIGFRVSTTGVVNGLTVTASHFDNNSAEGIYTAGTNSTPNEQLEFTNINISGSTFNNDIFKGIYAEKLDNATFNGITVDNSGTGTSSPNGVNLNLKYGTYTNITIENSTFDNDATGHSGSAAVDIEGRNDGSYASHPGSITGLTLTNLTFNGTIANATSPVDLALGGAISGVTMSGVQLQGAGVGLGYFGNSALSVGDTSFASTLSNSIVNSSSQSVDATGATFGGILASTATTAQQYAIAGTIIDGVDVSGYGLVRTSANSVYVTPASETLAAGAIGRAESLSSIGDTIHVEAALAFSTTTTSSITYGMSTITPSGTVTATNGSVGFALPSASLVNVSIPAPGNGATAQANISSGTFASATTLDTHNLHVAGSPYAVTYAYSDGYNVAFDSTTVLDHTTGLSPVLAVTPKALTASIINNPTKTYDGTTAATLTNSNFQIVGLVNGDNFSVAQSAGTYNSKNAESNDLVTATLAGSYFSPVGTTAHTDYTYPTAATGNGTITPESLTINATSDSKTYDGGTVSSQTPTVAVGAIYNNEVTYSQAFASKDALGLNGSTLVASYVVTAGGTGDYTIATNTATGTITPESLTINATSDSKTYDGGTVSSQTPTVAVGAIYNNEVTYSQAFASKDALGLNGSTLVASYVVTAGGTGDYTIATNTATGTITPESLTINATSDSKTYDGGTVSSQTPTVAVGAIYNNEVTYSQAFASKDALGLNGSTLVASYVVTAGGTGDYTIATNTATGTITPESLTINATSDSKTYDGGTVSSQTPTVAVGAIYNNEVTYSQAFASKDALGLNGSTLVASYVVTAGGTGDYTIATNTATGTITPESLTINATSDSKTYDGGTVSSQTPTVAVGAIYNNEVTYSQAFASKDALGLNGSTLVASYVVTAGGTGDYTIATNTATGTITPESLTINATSDSKTYDGGTVSSQTPTVAVGAIYNNEVTYSQAFASKDALGLNGSTLVASYVVTAGGTGDYTIATNTATGTITPESLTINATSDSKTYDGGTVSSQTPTVAVGAIYNNEVTYSQAFASKDALGLNGSTLVASYVVTAGGTGDYTIATNTATGTITPESLTINATSDSKTYDGGTVSSQTPTVAVGAIYNNEVTYSQAFASKDALGLNGSTLVASYVVTAGGTGDYTIATNTATGTITPESLTINATSDSKTYDGGTVSSQTPTVAVGAIYNNEVTYSQAFASKDALGLNGSTLVASYVVTAGGTGDYTIATNTATGTITPESLTINATSDSKTYDGGTVSSQTPTVAVGAIYNNEVTYSQAFASKDALGLNGSTLVASYVVTAGGTGDYTIATNTATGTITPESLTINATSDSKTYDGGTVSSQTPTVAVGAIYNNEVTYSQAFASKDALGLNGSTLVASYVVTAGGTGDYTIATNTATGTITPESLTINATSDSKTYDGGTVSSQTPTVAVGAIYNNEVTYSQAFASKDALGLNGSTLVASYVVTAGGTGDYTIATNTATGTITPESLTINATSDSKTYDGGTVSSQTPTVAVGAIYNNEVTYSQAFASKDALGLNGSTLVASYVVTAGGTGDYTIATNTATGTITPESLTINATSDSKTYDGGTVSSQTPTVAVGAIYNNEVTYSQAFASKDALGLNGSTLVASYVVTAGGTGDYTIATNTATGTITPESLTINATSDSKTYDGGTVSSQTPTVAVGAIYNNEVTYSQAFASKDALGLNGSTLVASYVVTAGGTGDYTIATNTATGTITPESLTINATSDSKTYDGGTVSSQTPTVAVGAIYNNEVTYSQAFASKDALGLNGSTLVASYVVTAGGTGDYTIATNTATGTITPESLTINATSDSKTYDGGTVSSQTPTVAVGAIYNNEVTYSQAFASKDALGLNGSTLVASYVVTAGGTGDYTIATNTATGTITPESLTINATSDSKTYDGGTVSSQTPTVAVGAIYNNEVTYSQAFASKDALGLNGSTLVASYVVTAGGTGDYTIATNTATGTITPESLTINATSDSKTYDGGTVSSQTPTVAVGAIYNNEVTYSQAFASKDALGLNGSTLVASYVVTAGGTGDYTIATNTATGTITQANITISAVTDTKTYDGATSSSLTPTFQVTGLSANTLFAGDTFTALSQSFTSKDVEGAGLSTLTVSDAISDTNSGGNYNVTMQTASGTINPKTLTDSIIGTPTKVYDGTTDATLTPANFQIVGLIGSESFSVNQTSGTYNSPDTTASTVTTTLAPSNFVPAAGTLAVDYTFPTTASGAGAITPANQTITWSNPADIVFGTPLSGTQLDATVSGVPGASGALGALTYTPASGYVFTSDGTQNLHVDAASTLDYQAASKNVSINIDHLTLTGSSTVNQGSLFTLNLSNLITPAGTSAIAYTVNWGDNGPNSIQNFTGAPSGNLTYTYDKASPDNLITVTVVLNGNPGTLVNVGTFNIQVLNVAPTASLDNLGGNVSQGQSGEVGFFNQFDPSHADTTAGFHYAYDFNYNPGLGDIFNSGDGTYGGSSSASNAVVPASYLLTPGTHTILGRIIDQNNGFTDYTTTITVDNVPPTINLPATASVGVNSVLTLNGSVTDPGGDINYAAATVNYGDGSGSQPLTINPVNGTFVLSHTYTAPSGGTPYQISVFVPDTETGTNAASTTQTVAVTATANTLEVANFASNTSGFDVTFDRALNPSSLKIYAAGSTLVPDVTLVGQNTGPVEGSLVWDASTDTLHFVRTQSATGTFSASTGYGRTNSYLAPDTYTVTLLSGAGGIKDATGSQLDGLNTGTPGSNFTATFTVSAPTSRVLTLPDVARAPGETINTFFDGTAGDSTNTASGMPIQISDGSGVNNVDFTLTYDPSVLSIPANGAFTAALSNWNVDYNVVSPGQVKVTVYSTDNSSLTGSSSAATLVYLNASVASTAAYGSSSLLALRSIVVNEGAIAAQGDESLLKATLLGDATGDGTLSSSDARLIARVTVGKDAGFDAYGMTDPRLVGDVTGDGTISGLDASYVSRASAGLTVAQLPATVASFTTSVAWDPTLNVPLNVVGIRGGTVSVPVTITDDAYGLLAADLGFIYNSALVHLSSTSAIQLNSALAGTGWQIGAINLNDAAGTVRISMYTSGDAISVHGAQNLLNLLFSVNASAAAGVSPVTIDQSGSPSHTRLNEGQLTLTAQSGSIIVNIGVTESGPSTDSEGTPATYTSSTVGATGAVNYAWSVTRNGNPYTPGTATNGSNFTFTPRDSGSYVVSLNVTDSATPTANTGSASASLAVADAPLTAATLTPPYAVVNQPLSNIAVFHFTSSTDNVDDLPNYSALVTLGDGNTVTLTSAPSANGQIVHNAGGGFDVELSYTYAGPLNAATFSVAVSDSTSTSTASASGTITAVTTPTFSSLSSPTIVYGTATTTISGIISGLPITPAGQVAITINGVTDDATIDNTGHFTDPFTTGSLNVVNGGYAISYTYLPSGLYTSYNIGTITGSGTLTVNKATATVVVTPYTVVYDGQPHTATVTSITGVNSETGATVGTVDVSNTTHTNAGTYASDSYTFTGAANYNNIAAQTLTDTINKATATVVVTPYTVVYDGQPHTATVTSITGVNSETGATVGTVDVSNTTHTNAGTYASDSYTFTGAANYNNIAATTLTDTINKATATVVVTPYTVVYDGQPHTATVTSITGVNSETGATVGTVDVSNTTHTNAGTYASDSYTFTGAANYNNIAAQTLTDTINKATATVVVTPYTVVYDGQPHTATVTSITGVNSETGATVGTVDVSNTTHTNAGTYASDSYTFTGAANYNNIAATTLTDTINKATATVVVTPYTVVYDGQPHTATVTSITGVNSETGATVGTVDVSNTTHTNAGTYASDSYTFTGAANYNNIAATTLTDTINKATATVVVTPYTVVYDGQPHTATVTSITGVNSETGATVGTVDVSNTTHTNAGTYASDSYTFTGAANYNNIAATTLTDTINKATATVVVTPYTVVYDGQPHTATVTSITGVNSETGATVGTVDVSNTTHTNAGTYASDSYTFTGAANYNNIAAQTLTDTINKATATVVVTPYTVVYDGQPHTATVTSITGVNSETGATVGTVDVSNTTHTNAGTYASDSYTFTGAANYNNIAAQTLTDTINKATATVVVTPYTVVYDGQPHTATVTSITGVNSETGATVGTVDVSNTTHTNAGTYASDSYTFTGAANYNNIAAQTLTDTINKANQTITWANPADILYGTALSSTQLNAVITGVAGGSSIGTVTYTPATGTVLNLGQNQALQVNVAATSDYNPASDTVHINVDTFQVLSTTVTTNGVDIQFNGPADLSTLHLYSGEVVATGLSDGLGAPDLVLLNQTTGQTINGSLNFDTTTDIAHFVATAGTLPSGNYQLSLVSYNGTDGWRDTIAATNNQLDGTVNGNYQNFTSSTFSVMAPAVPVLSLENFARGPGQDVNLPNTSTGLPVSLSNANGLTSVSLTLAYDPTLLTVNGVTLASGTTGWTLGPVSYSNGSVTVSASGTTALSAGAASLFIVNATVPSTAPYGASAVLHFTNESLNGGSIAAVASEAFQKVAFVGDTTGDRSYTSMDASLIARVVVGLDSGFDAYRLTDPVIVGDVTADGTLSGLDAAYVARAAVGLPTPQIPGLPAGNMPMQGGATVDPQVTVDTVTAQPGEAVVVPVTIDNAANLQAADFTFTYDTSLITMSNSDVTLGNVPSGWQYVTNVGDGLVRVSLYNATPLSSGSGTLLNLTAHISSSATNGTSTPVDIASGPTPSELNEGNLLLSPANGLVNISSVAPVTVTSVVVNGNNAALAGVQRSMVNSIVYTFSEAVTLAASNAFTFAVHAGQTGTAPTLIWTAISPDGSGASTQWVVTFSGAGVTPGGSIADGVYDITLNTAAVTSEAHPTATVTPRATDTFYRLYGDALGNAASGQKISNADYTLFLSTFGLKTTAPGYLAYFNEDGNTKIDNTDYNIFLANFGKKLTGFSATI